jgi:mRNA-degrading endonuclease RelE of RelBE toxin-antitoxin system
MMKITFTELTEFQRDLKHLTKKYPYLPSKSVFEIFPKGRGTDCDQIPNLKIKSKIYKTRIDCRSLKRDAMRLIYCYNEDSDLITLVEIYFKGDQQLETRERILKYFT